MNPSINFSDLRKSLDEAITFAELEKAEQIADQGLEFALFKEDLGEIMYFQAQHAILDENFNLAIRFLKEAVEYNPFDGAAYNDIALCMIEIEEDVHETMSYFDIGIEVEPDYATIFHNKGWFLNQLGRPQEAIAYLNKALTIEPDRAVTFENLADVYIKLGETAKAISAYQTSLRLLDQSYPDIRQQIFEKLKILMS
ncbi:MAG: tetratricopeptide repeat protein [Candidatus Omnitrophica bacterium]|nr:tetratricopeptide repeat protein [Candidatus Omnitrophota bacterium]